MLDVTEEDEVYDHVGPPPHDIPARDKELPTPNPS